MFVTEDTTRARPETLRALYGAAIACGARRVCLADTVGHATPDGVRALVRFVREEIIAPTKLDVRIDWHGHRDRGHGLANCMAAIEAGVDRVHGTALGIGERVGNAEMDLLLINLRLLGAHKHDLRKLPEYTRARLARARRLDSGELSGVRRGCLSHGNRCTRGGDREGAQEGRCVARGSHLFGRAGGRLRALAAHRRLARVGDLERAVVARGARLRRQRRCALPLHSRRGEEGQRAPCATTSSPALVAEHRSADGHGVSAPLSAVMSGYLDLRWRLNPVEATYHGVTEFDGQFAAYDAESVREQLAALVSYENAIEEAEAETLAEEIDRTAVLHSLRHDLLLLDRERKFAHDPSFHLMARGERDLPAPHARRSQRCGARRVRARETAGAPGISRDCGRGAHRSRTRCSSGWPSR